MPGKSLVAEVEILLLFSPKLQQGGAKMPPVEDMQRATHGWMTVQVYGTPAIGEISRRPVLEDLSIEADGEDIQDILPDQMVDDIESYVMDIDG